MNKKLVLSLIFAAVTLSPGVAMAYIGPGTTGGALAAAFGFIGAIFLAIVAVIYYPIKRALKGRKKTTTPTGSDNPAE